MTDHSVVLSVYQKDPQLLHRFAGAVGGGIVREKTTRNLHIWTVTGLANVQYVLGLLWPYLGETKKEQARVAVRTLLEMPRKRRAFQLSRLTVNE